MMSAFREYLAWQQRQTPHQNQRPTVSQVGYTYFDTTSNKPIWWWNAGWIDATGTTV